VAALIEHVKDTKTADGQIALEIICLSIADARAKVAGLAAKQSC
jgi:hypothetical protein